MCREVKLTQIDRDFRDEFTEVADYDPDYWNPLERIDTSEFTDDDD